MIKLFIDDIECKDFDWQNFSINIKRDKENRIVRITMPQSNTFRGDAYSIIRSAFNKYGWCATLPVVIQKACGNGYENIIDGLIFINDCEFRTQRCEVDVSITDNSFYAKLFNNAKIEYYTASEKSKNRETITTPQVLDLTLFRPSDGAWNTGFAVNGTRKCFDFKELLTHLLLFISDNTITHTSNWYDNLAVDKKLAVINGKELRLANGIFKDFRVSFSDLTTDVFNLYNLWTSFSGLEYNVETFNDYFNAQTLFKLSNVKDTTFNALQEEYVSNIKMGTYKATQDSQSFPIQRFTSFNEENYYISGVCNIVNELNLLGNKLICDTNIIEDVLINDNDAYDNDLFLIEYDQTTNKARRNYYSAATKYFYNESLLNKNVINNYSFNGDLYAVTDEITDRCRASFPNGTVGPVASPNPLFPAYNPMYYTQPTGILFEFNLFSDDSTSPNFDTDNRFNTSTNVYTAPEDGMYTFKCVWRPAATIFLTPIPTPNFEYYFSLVLVRGISGNISTEFTNGLGFVKILNNGSNLEQLELYATITTYLESGETVTPKYMAINNTGYTGIALYGDYQTWGESTFECVLAPSGGGEFKAGSGQTFKSSIFKFDQKLTASQVKLLLANPGHSFTFTEINDVEKKVWVNDITIQIKDNFASIEAISDLQNTQ